MAAVGRFFGWFDRYVVGFGLGTAAGPSLEPFVQDLANAGWEANSVRPLPPDVSAALVAHNSAPSVDWGREGRRAGVGDDRFAGLVQFAREYPDLASAIELRRRQGANDGDLKGWLRFQGFSDDVSGRLLDLQHARLTVADVANAVQQGFLPNDGILPADPGGTTNITPPVDEVVLNPHAEAADSGIDPARLKVLAELAGLPPGPMELLEMWRRGIITETAVEHGIREGHTKTKWTSAYKALKRPLLNPGVIIRLLLKGWIEKPEAVNRMALHGYTPDEVTDWYDAEGRPAAPQQMATAVARGIDGPDGRPMDEPQFLKGIRESDIRPEWGPMLWGIRHAYPSLFIINRFVTSGVIEPATGAEWARKDRYAPEVVDALLTSWNQAAGPTIDPRVNSARTNVVTRIRNAYIQQRADDAQATGWLEAIGIANATAGQMIDVWRVAREVPGSALTRAQVKRAFKTLPAEWPRQRALDELEALGLESDEAQTYLDE